MDVLETKQGDECISELMPYSLGLELGLFLVHEHVSTRAHMIFQKEADLQSMCLNVIVDNMDKFVATYWDFERQMKELNPQRNHVEILRRFYSDRLYDKISVKDCYLTLATVKLFLTPHWKKVRLRQVETFIPVLRTIGKTITSINLQDSIASTDLLTALLCCVPNIVYLNLVATECDGSVLALISKACKFLKVLNLGECQKVTDEGIAYLYNLDRKEIGFSSLKSLNINGTKVTEKSIPLILKYLTSLECLRYGDIEIVLYDLYRYNMISGNEKFSLINFEPTIHRICLPRYANLELKDILKLWTRVCPKVSRVHIEEDIDANLLRLLSKFEHLTALRLMDFGSSTILLTRTAFFRLRAAQLTEIHFTCIFLSIDDVINSCPNLKKLTLDKVIFKDCNIPEKAKLNDLEFLKLKSVNLKDGNVFKCLKGLLLSAKNLIKLGITYCTNFDEGIASCILDSSPNVTSLNLTYTDISPEILGMMLSSENIKIICADGCPRIAWPTEYLAYVNGNPRVNTCGWKLCRGFFDDDEEYKWSNTPWLQGIAL